MTFDSEFCRSQNKGTRKKKRGRSRKKGRSQSIPRVSALASKPDSDSFGLIARAASITPPPPPFRFGKPAPLPSPPPLSRPIAAPAGSLADSLPAIKQAAQQETERKKSLQESAPPAPVPVRSPPRIQPQRQPAIDHHESRRTEAAPPPRIAIVGAGPVGLWIALNLCRTHSKAVRGASGLRFMQTSHSPEVVVYEKRTDATGYGTRQATIAISAPTESLLRKSMTGSKHNSSETVPFFAPSCPLNFIEKHLRIEFEKFVDWGLAVLVMGKDINSPSDLADNFDAVIWAGGRAGLPPDLRKRWRLPMRSTPRVQSLIFTVEQDEMAIRQTSQGTKRCIGRLTQAGGLGGTQSRLEGCQVIVRPHVGPDGNAYSGWLWVTHVPQSVLGLMKGRNEEDSKGGKNGSFGLDEENNGNALTLADAFFKSLRPELREALELRRKPRRRSRSASLQRARSALRRPSKADSAVSAVAEMNTLEGPPVVAAAQPQPALNPMIPPSQSLMGTKRSGTLQMEEQAQQADMVSPPSPYLPRTAGGNPGESFSPFMPVQNRSESLSLSFESREGKKKLFTHTHVQETAEEPKKPESKEQRKHIPSTLLHDSPPPLPPEDAENDLPWVIQEDDEEDEREAERERERIEKLKEAKRRSEEFARRKREETQMLKNLRAPDPLPALSLSNPLPPPAWQPKPEKTGRPRTPLRVALTGTFRFSGPNSNDQLGVLGPLVLPGDDEFVFEEAPVNAGFPPVPYATEVERATARIKESLKELVDRPKTLPPIAGAPSILSEEAPGAHPLWMNSRQTPINQAVAAYARDLPVRDTHGFKFEGGVEASTEVSRLIPEKPNNAQRANQIQSPSHEQANGLSASSKQQQEGEGSFKQMGVLSLVQGQTRPSQRTMEEGRGSARSRSPSPSAGGAVGLAERWLAALAALDVRLLPRRVRLRVTEAAFWKSDRVLAPLSLTAKQDGEASLIRKGPSVQSPRGTSGKSLKGNSHASLAPRRRRCALLLVGDVACGKPFYTGATLNNHFADTSVLVLKTEWARVRQWAWEEEGQESVDIDSVLRDYTRRFEQRTAGGEFREAV
uniref:FAD/NAD(P)-binding domain-containing protein n=1 Tax=Chromera velia CCMP2878 TaxID=1169474 RepID=A0A0G4HMC3_9ALVE|eukprot:Cvel_7484.t1-p1 / transcript=Cvel_7484.t1 / gene=Cvel_7484 / organism=Chromera_velia_CCMP2878 / gene_product=hypothetical protein / transcript_product=hypothetical protein / location=Cvel_scaffold392:44173-47866(+) / protein_length=1074 / sequence_SO=supercontig / SO=protein_coding / is_pseudo=false